MWRKEPFLAPDQLRCCIVTFGLSCARGPSSSGAGVARRFFCYEDVLRIADGTRLMDTYETQPMFVRHFGQVYGIQQRLMDICDRQTDLLDILWRK